MPAFLLAGVGGGVMWMLLIYLFGFTAATTLTVPVVIGAVMGYAGKVRLGFKILFGFLALGVAITILASGESVGGFCGAILGALALIPVLLGISVG